MTNIALEAIDSEVVNEYEELDHNNISPGSIWSHFGVVVGC